MSLANAQQQQQKQRRDIQAELESPLPKAPDTATDRTRTRVDRQAQARRDRYVRERNERGRNATNIAAMQKLKVHDYGGQTEGHHVTWVNDYPGNIESHLERGFSPVLKDGQLKVGDQTTDYNSDLGTWVSAYVGKSDVGQPIRAYLLKIPLDWYQEDEADRSRRRDDVEKEIYGERMERNLNLKNMRHMKRKNPGSYYPEPDDKGIYKRTDMNRIESKPLGED